MSIGLYVHVPFCRKKCIYCDFISYSYDAEIAASYVYALKKEISLQAGKLPDNRRTLKSIYIGGGTPSCLSGDQLVSVMEACREHFTIEENAEITVECNPGTVDVVKFDLLRKNGVNRISMGVQAYQKRLLSFLGRIHDWDEVAGAVKECREAGFDNLNLDLIFGIPGQTTEDWKESLQRVVDLGPQHISAYNLKIEEGTPLQKKVAAGLIYPCDEELELEMYWFSIDFLKSSGFKHYEISNFAVPGRESHHNLIYWHNGEYLGIGPAAHSMIDGRRFSNAESVELYINKLDNGELAINSETILTPEERISETVFLALRLMEGLDLDLFEQEYGKSLVEFYPNQLKRLLDFGLVEMAGSRLRLTNKGLPLANEVFAEFI